MALRRVSSNGAERSPQKPFGGLPATPPSPGSRDWVSSSRRSPMPAAAFRPPPGAPWCDGHHLVHWADGGPTKLDNLGLVCRTHHRKVHEEGWKLRREKDGRWFATPPVLTVTSRSRSG